MIPYTSALPNKVCLKILDHYYDGWRFLLSPASVSSFGKKREHLLYERGYAIDNGVYSYWRRGLPFDDEAFIKLLDQYAEGADWIVIPDVVGDWWETARMFMLWYDRLIPYRKHLLYVAQDGIEDRDYATVRGMTTRGVGVFIGGSTDWKLEHAGNIAKICRENNATCHVGRVNSARRTRMCWNWGVSSFDGSGMSRFSPTAMYVSREMRDLTSQLRLF